MFRFFEILPATLSWGTLIILFFISWKFAAVAAIFIILFDTYWLLKTLYLSLHLRYSFTKMRENEKRDWLNELNSLTHNSQQALNSKINWQDIYHLVILPMYNEPYDVVKESFESLVKMNYPLSKMILVLAIEEKAGEGAKNIAQKIEEEFGGKFYKFLVTTHPMNVPGEIPGKGSNESYAAEQVKKMVIDPARSRPAEGGATGTLGCPASNGDLDYENILVSVFDVDTQIGKEYFGLLTYKFLTCEKPQRTSFQPIPLFTNNIFEAPALARVVSFSATFWHMMQQARPERLTTFSSHSMPFKALVEIGYWHRDVVSEDSRIFWQLFLHYDGDWRVEPMFYPVSMDANVAPGFWKTMINIYKQQRRWGWGVENVPYLLNGFRKNKNIPFKTKFYWAFNIIEGFHSWATNAIIIFAMGWLPILIGGHAFDRTILAYNLPKITGFILNLSTIGIASSAILSIILLPPKPKGFKPWYYALYLLQWILMPFTLIIFGAIPGLEAQTRLALSGKFRLGFWVTPKGRYKSSD
ncbi:MAG: glycosyltransferase family 2 protein [Patescibacteria group bacterium]|nr:glycosyltransferase family 2 protein [Patescibacteria group bacterium]